MRLVSQPHDATVTIAGDGTGSANLPIMGMAIMICVKDTDGASYDFILADSDGYTVAEPLATLIGDSSTVCQAPCAGTMTISFSSVTPTGGTFSVRVYTDHGFIF